MGFFTPSTWMNNNSKNAKKMHLEVSLSSFISCETLSSQPYPTPLCPLWWSCSISYPTFPFYPLECWPGPFLILYRRALNHETNLLPTCQFPYLVNGVKDGSGQSSVIVWNYPSLPSPCLLTFSPRDFVNIFDLAKEWMEECAIAHKNESASQRPRVMRSKMMKGWNLFS